MKNFGNRGGYRNNNNNNTDIISDARQVLSAKRNNNFVGNNVRTSNYVDARLLIPNRVQPRPPVDFAFPKKTVQNELYLQDLPHNPNFINKPPKNISKISLSTNKFSGKSFSDPNASQGIFSNDIQSTVTQQKSAFVNRNNIVLNNPMKRSNFKVVNDSVEVKRKRDTSVENMKFTVVNTKPVVEQKKPPLSTAKFAQKKINNNNNSSGNLNSLVSPIQGYRIEVKNLHPQVNIDDVYELFTSLGGELRSCNLVRAGYAEVVFRRLVDAEKSIGEFHGRELDGKPMNLKLVTVALESVSNDSPNSEVKAKISRIQANRKPAHGIQINTDAVFRSMYAKSTDLSSKVNKKPFKFSVTL